MLFNSLPFFIFFPVVTLLFFLLPHKYRWAFLLAASCFFYMFFKPEYILILAFTIIIDYYAGIWIENEPDDGKRKRYLILSLAANIGVLAFFKYYNFINSNITGVAGLLGMKNPLPYLSWLLPIGLSFHTFQAMSYTIEIYRGRQKAERHIGIYALYVMFYPQLVAGPIERPGHLIRQFYIPKQFTSDNAVHGLTLIIYGLFKKMVVADRISVYVDEVYAHPAAAGSTATLLAVFFYSIQIYCDFSGYTDIARGAAKVMGFDLMINFNRPYLAASISDFWSRWHISLSSWFRDYVYIPLGGSREGVLAHCRNLLIVFMISGLWHGANWTFIAWGALHGIYMVIGALIKSAHISITRITGRIHIRWLYQLINQCITFALVSFAWIFFRSENFPKARAIMHNLWAGDFSQDIMQLTMKKGILNFMLLFFVAGLLALSYLLPANMKMKHSHSLLFLFITTFIIILLGRNGGTEFIYFQF